MVGNLILPWRQHLRKSIPLSNKAYKTGLASGDFEPASLARLYESQLIYLAGEPLVQLGEKLNLYSECIRRLEQEIHLTSNKMLEQVVANLSSNNNIPSTLLASSIQEENLILKNFEKLNYNFGLFGFYFHKVHLNYLFEQPQAAQKSIIKAKEYIDGVTSQPIIPLLTWYESLLFFALVNCNDRSSNRDISFSSIENSISELSQWAELAPMNFQHKYDLVEAEKSRFLGNKLDALELYDRAIAGAKENQYIQEEALANELAAKFYLDRGKEKIAAGYMQEAYDCYARWDAKAKMRHLEQNYPELLGPILQFPNYSFNPLETLSSLSSLGNDIYQIDHSNPNLNDTFYLTEILQSARALTEILELDELLKKLSEIILYNSGCDHIILALQDDFGDWQINVDGNTENSKIDSNSSEIHLHNPLKLINYIKNTQAIVMVNNLETDLPIIDEYLLEKQPQSLFALPLKHQEQVIGVLYLHSSHIKGLFNPEKITVLEFLCSQASIALNNAQLFADANLKSKVIESSVDGTAIVEDERFSYLNKRHLDLYGYELEELIGKPWEKLYLPADIRYIQQKGFPILKKTGKWSGEVTAQRKDGTTFPEEVSLFLLNDQKLICICRDISDRKAAEQSLINSENKFRTLVSNIDGAVYHCKNDADWTMEFLSNAIVDLSGYPVSDFINNKKRTYASIVHPDDLELVRESIALGIENHRSFTMEYRIVHKNGSIRWVTEKGKGIFNEDNKVQFLEGVLFDISDRKIAEQSLVKSENKFRTLVGNIDGAVYRCENTIECKFDYISPAIFQLTGYLVEEFANHTRSYGRLIHPEDAENAFQAIKKAVENHESFAQEYRIIHQDGSIRWVTERGKGIYNQSGQAKGLEGVIYDISDRKAAEAALKLSEARAKAAFEQAAVGIIEADLNGYLTRINEYFCEMTGYTQSELQKFSIKDLTHLDDLPESKEYIQKLHHNEIEDFTLEKRYVRKDGSIFWAATTVSLINIPGEQARGTLAIVKDISDRKAAEQQLQKLSEKLELAIESAQIGIWELTFPDQRLSWNDRMFNIYGIKPEEFEGTHQDWENLVHPEYLEQAQNINIQNINNGETNFSREFRILRPDGSIRNIVSTGLIQYDENEQPLRIVGTNLDISDRKAIKRQLEFTQYGLDHAADCFYCLDNNAKIVQVNDASCERTGYTKEQLLGMTIHDLAPTYPRELTWKSHWEKLKHFNNYSFEAVHQTATGENFPVEVVCNYLEFDGQAYSFELVRDITERRQAEEALIQQQNHLAALLNNIPHIAWIKDEQSRFIAVNQPFAQACGTPIQDIIGKTDYNVWPIELAQNYRDDDFEVLTLGKRKVVEERVALADGTKGWLETTKTPFKNANGEFVGTVGIAADLTERKQSELALAESEAKFRTLVENARDIIFSMTPEGVFTYISPQVEQILGYKAEQLISQSCQSFVHPEDIFVMTNWLNSLETTPEQGKKVADEKIRLPHITGGWRWIVFSNTPVKDASGKIISVQGIGRDVTEIEQKRQALTAIAEGTAAKTGADFYQACVRYLTTIFQVKYGFLSQLNPQSSLKSKMLVLWNGQEFIEPYEINLAGTPCLETYKQNSYIASDSLSALFPEADVSAKLGMESYAGVKIVDSQGQVIGNLGIMDSKAFPKDSSTIEFILQLFATRVGAEMERQTTEDALRKSQAQLQAFIDNSPSAIFQKDLEGHYQLVNQTLINLFDFDRDTLVSQSDFELYPEDIAQRLRKNDQEVITSKNASTLEEVVPHPDGSIHTYIANKFPLLDDQGNPYALGGVSTDITELKRAELALKESQAKFRRMTENVPGVIYRYVLHADGNHGITYASSQIRQIYELEPQVALKNVEHLWERIHPDDISKIDEVVRTSAETLEPFEVEHRLILPEKGLRWIQAFARAERLDDGDVIWDGLALDITDRKLAEARQQRQLAILETTSDFIGTTDPQGNILYLNEAWRNLLRGDKEEPCNRIMIAEHHPAWAFEIVINEALVEAAKHGMWAGEIAILDSDGVEIPVSQVIIAHKSKDGEVEYFSTILRDISDRKRAEEKLQQTNEQLVRATQMKDEFLANMSHELRTPLNAILGMTESLQEGIFGKINQEQIKALNTIEHSGSHLLELIDDILDLTKIESGYVELEYSAVEVNHLCQSSLAFIKQQAQKKLIQLHLNTPFSLPTIRVDERRIRQVLINLLNNAVKFTPEGGSITLEVTVLPPKKSSDLEYLSFAIQDTGIGIAEHDLKKLFQPFMQIDSSLNRQYEGTGLGLFLVKRIIDLHNGNLTVTSKVEIGSCFTINLPYQSVAASKLKLRLTKETSVTPKTELVTSPLILLAEDNTANSSIISTYLQTKGYRLQIAHDGQSALDLVQAEQPDLILMDIQMPGMDGLTAIKYLRQDFPTVNMPIIALTAFAMEEDRKKCLAAGANLYLAKPVRLKKLVMEIQKLLGSK